MGLTAGETKDKTSIKITIEVMSWLKEDFGYEGWGRLVIEEALSPGTSILNLLRSLGEKYPRFGQKAFGDPRKDFFDYCAIVLNGTFLSGLPSLNAELKDGDSLIFSPGFYGG
jgi:hypothetical protein